MDTFENRHRQRKRKKEMEIIMQKIAPFIGSGGERKILEFGSGDGYQIPYLKKLGSLVASDTYKNDEICKNHPDVEFVTCDIRNTPFPLERFDLIFSNHVLEHIEDIASAFAELKRIGSNRCIYTFTVPTSTWLLFSVPAQGFNLLRRILKKEPKSKAIKRKREGNVRISGWRRFLPAGHGWRKDFFDCFKSFRIESWQRLLSENGFKVIERIPLLLYAPSEFPVVPTTRFLVNQGVYSSVIFVLKKVNDPSPSGQKPIFYPAG